ncbi:DUF7853 family protein [Natronorubrum thiooxidans]|uniref:Uncharacterized protein n=1 Tax=Natronorubrum thiooxidans TaxID=308853 RepID=A0A1N7DQU3_9EURY|nr:hypothetical protein [Natronorubrum thiooxidans]SIR78055.1 hypothetical protein SAMN05421752_102435 [Natronorubrum thiooxidans]
MSSPQPEKTETHEVTLSRDEQWVTHHLLVSYLDEAIDNDERALEWVLESIDAIEAGDRTAVLTSAQARNLFDAMTSYVDAGDAPERDVTHGSSVVDRLETRLESVESTTQ